MRTLATRLRSRIGRPTSLRGRLTRIILVTLAGALLTMTVALLYRDLRDYREALAGDLSTDAAIMALLAAPALGFDVPETAERNLSAFREKAIVRAAGVYTIDGRLYAGYAREDADPPPARLPGAMPGVRIEGDRMHVIRSVVRNGETLGAIYLRATYDVWGRVHQYLGILGLIMLLSMGVALTLAARLRQRITGPVEAFAAVADDIVSGRNPGRRAPDMPLEEFATVARAFNNVLDESDQRTQALRQSEKLYRAIGESINYGVWLADAQGHNIYVSDSLLRLMGITQEQCSRLGWCDMLHPEDADATAAAWLECVRNGDNWYREHRFRGADGQYHPILAQGVPMRDDAGRITGWAGINLDISRLKKTEDALREADRRKDDFLATLAHELRNPLAPIRHAARLLHIKGLDEQQAQAARDIISRQVARMALLLDDLLEVSRVTLGRVELRRERVSIASVVKVAVETSKPMIDQKRHELSVTLPESPMEMEVDPLRLSQALSNLLTNAAKYTDPGGRIALQVRCVEGTAVFSVRDSGIGIAANALPMVFEMFSQVDSAIDRSEGGLGIGLALVKGLVRLHGGTVHAASEGPGRGSTFTLRIPGCWPEAAADPTTGGAPAAASGLRGSILVVDDNIDAASSLAMVLRSAGHTVLTANGGEEGIAVAARLRPDVVLLDIGMPDLNGYDVARRMRYAAWGKKALLVALTGWGQKEDIERAHGAGFDFHMTKPADPERIERLVAEFLGSRQHA